MTKILLTLYCLFLLLAVSLKTTDIKIAAQSPANNNPATAQEIRTTTQSEIREQAQTQTPNIPPNKANAPEDEPVNNRAQIQIQQTQDNTVKQTEQSQEQAQDKMQQNRNNIAAVHAFRLEKRFTFYYQRLTKIAEKIETRLQLLADEDIDVTSAQQSLANTLLLLEQAMEQSNIAIANFKSIDPTQYQTQRQLALQARDEAIKARQLFNQALIEMQQVVQEAISATE